MNKDKFESAEKEIEKLDSHYPNSDLSHVYKRHKEQLSQIINCVANIKNKKYISDSDLQILEQGVRNSWQEVFYYQAGKYLCEFAYKYENAKELFSKLYNDKDYKVRFNVVTILLNEPPKNIIENILSEAVMDKSQKVRDKAEDVIYRLNLNRKFFKIKITAPNTRLAKKPESC